MKKIISILSSLIVVSSIGTTILACSNKPPIKDGLKDTITNNLLVINHSGKQNLKTNKLTRDDINRVLFNEDGLSKTQINRLTFPTPLTSFVINQEYHISTIIDNKTSNQDSTFIPILFEDVNSLETGIKNAFGNVKTPLYIDNLTIGKASSAANTKAIHNALEISKKIKFPKNNYDSLSFNGDISDNFKSTKININLKTKMKQNSFSLNIFIVQKLPTPIPIGVNSVNAILKILENKKLTVGLKNNIVYKASDVWDQLKENFIDYGMTPVQYDSITINPDSINTIINPNAITTINLKFTGFITSSASIIPFTLVKPVNITAISSITISKFFNKIENKTINLDQWTGNSYQDTSNPLVTQLIEKNISKQIYVLPPDAIMTFTGNLIVNSTSKINVIIKSKSTPNINLSTTINVTQPQSSISVGESIVTNIDNYLANNKNVINFHYFQVLPWATTIKISDVIERIRSILVTDKIINLNQSSLITVKDANALTSLTLPYKKTFSLRIIITIPYFNQQTFTIMKNANSIINEF